MKHRTNARWREGGHNNFLIMICLHCHDETVLNILNSQMERNDCPPDIIDIDHIFNLTESFSRVIWVCKLGLRNQRWSIFWQWNVKWELWSYILRRSATGTKLRDLRGLALASLGALLSQRWKSSNFQMMDSFCWTNFWHGPRKSVIIRPRVVAARSRS